MQQQDNCIFQLSKYRIGKEYKYKRYTSTRTFPLPQNMNSYVGLFIFPYISILAPRFIAAASNFLRTTAQQILLEISAQKYSFRLQDDLSCTLILPRSSGKGVQRIFSC